MYNKVILIGRLTKDPENKVTNAGLQVCTFTLAVNRTFASANGEKETDFFNCVCFGKQAENVGRFVKKGSMINVEGRIQNRSYEQDGVKKYYTDIICEGVVFLDTKQQSTSESNYSYQQPSFNTKEQQPKFSNNPMFANQQQPKQQSQDNYFEENPSIDISEDDLPF